MRESDRSGHTDIMHSCFATRDANELITQVTQYTRPTCEAWPPEFQGRHASVGRGVPRAYYRNGIVIVCVCVCVCVRNSQQHSQSLVHTSVSSRSHNRTCTPARTALSNSQSLPACDTTAGMRTMAMLAAESHSC